MNSSISLYDISLAGIALLALGVSFWQFHIQREHNKLSVRPLLVLRHEWTREAFKDREIFKYRKVYLENVGLGPAIITNFIFTNEGEVYPLSTAGNIDTVIIDHTVPFIERAEKLDREKTGVYPGIFTTGMGLKAGIVLKPGEKINIITLELNDKHFSLSVDGKDVDPEYYGINLFNVAVNFLEKAIFHIDYKSLYNEKQKPLKQNLTDGIDFPL